MKNGTPVSGKWAKALVRLSEGVRTNATQRRNVNDFLRHIPVGVLLKGTRLHHVSANADWVTSGATVGGNVKDGYSFFTLENKGFAAQHGNNFRSRIQMELTEDVHCFFIRTYGFRYWHPTVTVYPRGSQTHMDRSAVQLGGELARVIKRAWPENFRPAAWASCSECELAFHNSIISDVMRTTGAATSDSSFQNDRRIVPLGPSNVPSASRADISTPGWMSPYFYSGSKIAKAEEHYRKRNQVLDPGFFEPFPDSLSSQVKALFR